MIYIGTFDFGTFIFCISTCKNKPSLAHRIFLTKSYYQILGDYKSISELYLMSKNGTVKPINWVWVATNVSKNINPQLGPRQISLSKSQLHFIWSAESWKLFSLYAYIKNLHSMNHRHMTLAQISARKNNVNITSWHLQKITDTHMHAYTHTHTHTQNTRLQYSFVIDIT